jgi:hypothetical protein
LKWYKKPTALLLLLLVSSTLVMTAAGLTLKHTVAKSNQQIQDSFALAVPFLLLKGDVVLDSGTIKDPDPPEVPMPPEPDVEPPTPTPEAPDGTDTPTQGDGTDDPKDNPKDDPREEDPKGEEVPKPSFVPVEESYFDSALFIGDSRTVGLSLYGRLGKADYFADVGMSLFNLFDKSISDKAFENQSLRSLLQSKQYETIYLMLGINEIGYPLTSIEKKLLAVLEEIKTLQPDASIILEANLGVTKAKEEKSPQISMERIRALNEMFASHTNNENIFYLDVNPYFADANGYLRPEVTSDGTHPYAKEYQNWSIWLKGYGLTKAE